MMLRKALHAQGLRYRLHAKGLPGRPDLLFPKYHAALMVHGCFWHGHDCPAYRLPATRTDFWLKKIGRNQQRDQEVRAALSKSGWRVLTVWECSLRGPGRLSLPDVVAKCVKFIKHGKKPKAISGSKHAR